MKVSIITPVLNEEDNIDKFIEQLYSLDTSGIISEVIVVDGDEEGSTIGTISFEWEKLLTMVSPKGRAFQMNVGAGAATGEVLLFLHADTLIPVDGLASIEAYLKKGIDCGAFSFSTDSKHLFLKLVSFFTNIRSRMTKVPYGDQGIFMKKSVFDEIGGYSEIPILEDVDLMKRLKKRGYSIGILSEKAVTSCRRWEKQGVYRTTFKHRWIMLRYYVGIKPQKLKR